ncbi:Bypass of stop codon protein 6 [Lasiodiplodia hormozganensis]|uniref:Bypass of stop codon protein 6 n=2 Tax=Lasiodiplodia TaxID=66739 RepID=A0A5N5CZB9_9PEZI|nr:MFS protein transporter [Lasiodiplodia theobromae]KAB2570739.1 Bypass of stop codon protein 6 [Lasiodiplodia theobromae]KAF4535141.1 MFS protein transporter [Lasiodiplodia theobromae]KAK0615400.1 Bypass of stop codon protein 6 [Lasiodiplodia hormozganensis]
MSLQSAHHGGSSTCVIELQDTALAKPPAVKRQGPQSIKSLSLSQGPDEDPIETLPSPTTATEKLQRWNNPRVNMWRTFSAFWSFFIMGANDAAYGALLPYLEQYYGLSYTVVSLVFLSPLIGYCASALLNNTIHLKFGQRGIAFLGPFCHIIAYVVICVHPPYPVLVVVFALAGFGNGLEDAGWNAWMGAMANANEILGFLHGLYSVGATVSPLIATSMITKASLQWFDFYYVMVGCSVLELAFCLATFWHATAAVFRSQNPKTSSSHENRMREALTRLPAARVTWLCALFLLVYVGVEVALGGWIVTFMLRVRGGAAFASGMTATGFWLGMAVGRVALGFVTPRIGEKLAIAIYLPICAALELLFWLVPSFLLSAIAVAFQGFFLGPMFPGAVVAATKLLPRHLHVSAIGFAAAIGGSGAAVFPFAVGAIAQKKGVQVLQPFVLALIVGCWIFWMGLPRMSRKRE